MLQLLTLLIVVLEPADPQVHVHCSAHCGDYHAFLIQAHPEAMF